MKTVKQTHKKRKLLLFMTLIFCFTIIGAAVFDLFTDNIYDNLEKTTADITYFTRYGTSLNIKGELDTQHPDRTINKVNLILYSENEEYTLPLLYESNSGIITFETSSHINDGINLDTLPEGDWLVLLSVCLDSDDTLYYSLQNKTEYSGFTYYTVTHNNTNNSVNLDFSSHTYNKGKKTEHEIPLCTLNIVKTTLPEEVYDFAIEVGHGGDDPGAVGTLNNETVTEFSINLAVSLKVKELLTSAGYKVILTHEDNIDVSSYGYHARATLANDVKAKYSFSIHSNSHETTKYSGTEIYAANNSDYTFAKLLSDRVVEYSKGSVSNLDNNTEYYFSPVSGVYVRLFSDSNVKSTNEEIVELGAEPYENIAALKTNYYYMIREVGGISTGAYVDGRNPDYDKNPYYNSNNTAEPYIIELNYVNNEKSLETLVNNSDGYAYGIYTAVDEFIKSMYE